MKYKQLVGRGSRETLPFAKASELIDYCIDNDIYTGKVWVESNAINKGEAVVLHFYIGEDRELGTDIYGQSNIHSVNYAFSGDIWQVCYSGSFQLVIPAQSDFIPDCQFTKPEVYAVGDVVEILENAKECESYKYWTIRQKLMVGEKYKIISVNDDVYGVNYTIRSSNYRFPYYCIKKVELKERKKK